MSSSSADIWGSAAAMAVASTFALVIAAALSQIPRPQRPDGAVIRAGVIGSLFVALIYLNIVHGGVLSLDGAGMSFAVRWTVYLLAVPLGVAAGLITAYRLARGAQLPQRSRRLILAAGGFGTPAMLVVSLLFFVPVNAAAAGVENAPACGGGVVGPCRLPASVTVTSVTPSATVPYNMWHKRAAYLTVTLGSQTWRTTVGDCSLRTGDTASATVDQTHVAWLAPANGGLCPVINGPNAEAVDNEAPILTLGLAAALFAPAAALMLLVPDRRGFGLSR